MGELGARTWNEPQARDVVATAIDAGTVLRLKSWVRGEEMQSIMLAGQAFRMAPGTSVAAGAMRVLCLAAAEWLVVAAMRLGPDAVEVIRRELAAQGVAAADVSDGLSGFRLAASGGRVVLSKGCGLDLHASRFEVGRCVRTRLAQVAAVIDCVDGPPRFDIYVARSHGDYLGAWLRDAAGEWGETAAS